MLQYHEFKTLCEPIIIKTSDVLEVEDQGEHLKAKRAIDPKFAGPLLRKGPDSVVQPFGNNLEENLKVYDDIMAMSQYEGDKKTPTKLANSQKLDHRGGRTSPLRKSAVQQDVYSTQKGIQGSIPYPQGPPLTEYTNVHSGSVPLANMKNGPMTLDDERELTQLLFDMIQQELWLEKKK